MSLTPKRTGSVSRSFANGQSEASQSLGLFSNSARVSDDSWMTPHWEVDPIERQEDDSPTPTTLLTCFCRPLPLLTAGEERDLTPGSEVRERSADPAEPRPLITRKVPPPFDTSCQLAALPPMGINSSYMRPQDKVVFLDAARHFHSWILVRRTNPASLPYVGLPGYSPKRIDCKAKTADLDVPPWKLAGVVTAGWTRDYTVQLVQNFERKERGSAERTITAKIVVTCKVTIHGFGAHTGLGEEWADNDNAGTAAEAQAFKRACSCFGLGRYLYDLEGQWVDLDEKKRPLETPRLPDWARPKSRPAQDPRAVPRENGSAPASPNGNGTGRNGRGGLYRDELLAQVASLSDAVGFSLARGVLKAVANVEDASKIRDMAKLTMTFERLQDLARGVERLRTAIGKCGAQWYSTLCRELTWRATRWMTCRTAPHSADW